MKARLGMRCGSVELCVIVFNETKGSMECELKMRRLTRWVKLGR
jgi:hypothetical protein